MTAVKQESVSTNLFGTRGSCTCGFADVPAELPCEVHMSDSNKSSNPVGLLSSALRRWDRLRHAREVMQEDGIDFGAVLTRRAEAMEDVIAAARIVVCTPDEPCEVHMSDSNIPSNPVATTLTITTGPQVHAVANSFMCPKCGGHYFSIPRLGISHVCYDPKDAARFGGIQDETTAGT